MKFKISKSQWEEMGKKAGWIKKAEHLNGKPILNPENAEGENLYEIALGGVTNVGLMGFEGYVYAFDEQEAVDRVLDKYPNLGIDVEDIKDYPEGSISFGGNEGIPYLSEDLRVLKLVKKPQSADDYMCENCGSKVHHTNECPYSLGANPP